MSFLCGIQLHTNVALHLMAMWYFTSYVRGIPFHMHIMW